MIKKFWLIALIVACTVVFGSCDKSEELSVEQCKLDMNLFNQTYTVNDEGCCVLKGRKPIAAEEIQSKVKGYAGADRLSVPGGRAALLFSGRFDERIFLVQRGT